MGQEKGFAGRRGWSRAREGSGNLEEGITPKAGMHSLERQQGRGAQAGNCRAIQARNKWERGCGTAQKEEDKILGKNLWNDLEKIPRPQKVGTQLGCARCWDQGLVSLRESVKNEAGKRL